MSKFTDELFDLCVAVVDSHHLDRLFLNFGNRIDNSKLFEDYLRDMCDVDKLYVIYDYEIYYQGDIVTDVILREEQKNAAVLPVNVATSVTSISEVWESILSNDKFKERVDVTLDCLTHRFALIDTQIFNVDFLKYMTFVIKGLVFHTISKEDEILTGIKMNGDHILIVGDADKLADFELEMRRFLDAHLMKTL